MNIVSKLSKIHRDLYQTEVSGVVYDIRRTRGGWCAHDRFDGTCLTAPAKEVGQAIFLLKSRLMRSKDNGDRTTETTDKSVSK